MVYRRYEGKKKGWTSYYRFRHLEHSRSGDGRGTRQLHCMLCGNFLYEKEQKTARKAGHCMHGWPAVSV